MKVRVTHRESCHPIGTILEVSEQTIKGPLTGYDMYPIIDEKAERQQYIHCRFCEELK